MTRADASFPSDEPPSFEQALAGLKHIVHQLEEGQLGLEEALKSYEEGMQLLRQCHELLQCAERKIELLSGVDAEGQPITRPFDDEASFEKDQKGAAAPAQGARAANRRRSAEVEEAPRTRPRRPEPDEPGMDVPGGLF